MNTKREQLLKKALDRLDSSLNETASPVFELDIEHFIYPDGRRVCFMPDRDSLTVPIQKVVDIESLPAQGDMFFLCMKNSHQHTDLFLKSHGGTIDMLMFYYTVLAVWDKVLHWRADKAARRGTFEPMPLLFLENSEMRACIPEMPGEVFSKLVARRDEMKKLASSRGANLVIGEIQAREPGIKRAKIQDGIEFLISKRAENMVVSTVALSIFKEMGEKRATLYLQDCKRMGLSKV